MCSKQQRVGWFPRGDRGCEPGRAGRLPVEGGQRADVLPESQYTGSARLMQSPEVVWAAPEAQELWAVAFRVKLLPLLDFLPGCFVHGCPNQQVRAGREWNIPPLGERLVEGERARLFRGRKSRDKKTAACMCRGQESSAQQATPGCQQQTTRNSAMMMFMGRVRRLLGSQLCAETTDTISSSVTSPPLPFLRSAGVDRECQDSKSTEEEIT